MPRILTADKYTLYTTVNLITFAVLRYSIEAKATTLYLIFQAEIETLYILVLSQILYHGVNYCAF